MKYYVAADTHGFYDEFKSALDSQGFFEDTAPHKLIICGDLFDRGTGALQLQSFILNLMDKDEVILIKGNHEDLAMDLLNGWAKCSYLQPYHHLNGTINTALQLTQSTSDNLINAPDDVEKKLLLSPYIQRIIPAMIDYYETPHYIFTHGWIPCTATTLAPGNTEYVYMDDWRNAGKKAWNSARWMNGMEAAHSGVVEPEKTIVCGHWHCSFGHAHYESRGGEFDNDPDFSPYYGKGIIALDACSAFSGKVNCIALED